MTFTVGQLVAPLHRTVLVVAMVVLNAVVIPAAAWGIAEVSPMGSKYVPGLVLATVGALSAAAQLARRADLPLAVSVVVVLQLVNIVAVPLWAGRSSPAHRSVPGTLSRACFCWCSCRW
jgi:predicted Na+-dependent transporter